MPAISRFFGIVIAMYFDDHNPPPFHTKYQEHEPTLSIAELEVLEGSPPQRALVLVLEWATLHRDEWTRQGVPLEPIEPLR